MLWRRLTFWLGLVSLVAFLFVTLTPVTNIVAGYAGIAPQPGSAEAIIVLATGVKNDGSLKDESMRRLIHGLLLFKSGRASLLVLSGMTQRGELSEARTRSETARQFDVPADRLILITDLTTRGEALSSSESLRPRNVRKILLVTESIHMRRAKLLFERAGFEVLASPWDQPSETALLATDRLWLAYRLVQETLALLYYRAAGYI